MSEIAGWAKAFSWAMVVLACLFAVLGMLYLLVMVWPVWVGPALVAVLAIGWLTALIKNARY